MPIYEYICRKCGNKFEIIHYNTTKKGNWYSDRCPQCGGFSDRVMSNPSIAKLAQQ